MTLRVILLMLVCSAFGVAQDQLLLVHRKSMRVDFIHKGVLVCSYPIRIGNDTHKTPLGKGTITYKMSRPVFRYVDPGPKRGKIVDVSECVEETVKIDYRKMRALRMVYSEMNESKKEIRRRGLMPKGEYRFSFHSVVCPETIGKAISKGCVGLSMSDMLELYGMVRVDPKKNIYPAFEVRDD